MTGVRNLGPVGSRDFPFKLKAGESRHEEESIYGRAANVNQKVHHSDGQKMHHFGGWIEIFSFGAFPLVA